LRFLDKQPEIYGKWITSHSDK